MKKDTLIIIPVYNEEDNIGSVIDEINEKEPTVDIIVINDGSIDNTEKIVLSKGINILSLPFNFGYGNALQLGFKYALQNNYNNVIQFDGDGQHNPADISKIKKTLDFNKYDIVIGSRFINKSDFKISLSKKMALYFLKSLIYLFSNYKINDPTSGLQGLSKKTYSYYSKPWNYPNDYPDADVLIKMLKLGFTTIEIPVNMRSRSKGQSMHSGLKPFIYMLKITLSILVVVLNCFFNRRRGC
ncbi:MAG: glycosyltransferase family 2 protein [Clostridiales bacterium]